MAKFYENQKTHMAVASGKLVAISPERDSFTIETNKYDKATKTNSTITVEFKSATPVSEDLTVGNYITVSGFYSINPMDPSKEGYQAVYVSGGNECFEYSSLAVVNGDVVFARYNEEKNEDGTPKMTKQRPGADGTIIPPKAKKPHFDIGVSVETAEEDGSKKRTLHTVSEYPYKDDTTKIDRWKKLFANFDPKENPVKATIVTAPGRESSSQREYNGNTYTNYYSNHMGISSLDVEFSKERTKSQENAGEKKEVADNIPEVKTPDPIPAPQVNGLNEPAPIEETADLGDDVFIE